MARLFYHVMQDNAGNLLFGVSGTMRLAGTGTLATIYGDENLTVIVPNPMTNHATFGSFKCFLGAGDYDFYMAKTDYTFETLTGIQGYGTMAQQNADSVNITGGSASLAALVVDTPTLLVDPTMNSVGFGTAPDASWAIRAANAEILGGLRVDGSTLVVDPVANGVGIGVNPNSTWALRVSNAEVVGSLAVDGNTLGVDPTMNSVGFGTAPVAGQGMVALTAQIAYLGLGTPSTAPHVLVTAPSSTSLLRGNIGINATPNPANALTVVGDSSFAGGLYVDSVAINSGTAKLLTLVIGAPLTLPSGTMQHIWYLKASTYGLTLTPTDNDTGSAAACNFRNTSGVSVGNINTTATTTAYNTASDGRLKEEVTPLEGALDVIRALRPVAFRWKANGTPGQGLLAQEVAEVVEGVITGDKDAVDEDGQIQPQMIDYSKLVPYLIGAVKDLTQQVDILTAKLAGT